MNNQQPLTPASTDGAVKLQFGALCWRAAEAGVEVLLITSSAGNWILPKGRPIKGTDGAGAAVQEAWEEAGVRGELGPCLGTIDTTANGSATPCRIEFYALEVRKLAKKFPEAKKRTRRWASLAEAGLAVANPEIAAFLKSISPESLVGATVAQG